MPWTKAKWREWSKAYYARRRAEILAKKKAEYPSLRAGQLRRLKQWRQNNPAAAREADKRHREKHKRKRSEAFKKWYRANLDSQRNRASAYIRAHPEKNRNNQHLRRAVTGNVTRHVRKRIEDFIKSIRRKHSVNCYYCNKPVSGKKAHIDHVIALRGTAPGAHSLDNLCVACPTCNHSKKNRPLTAWQPNTDQQILPL